ncbi:hypothetical protein TVAG_171600 [Trichomonas vaginalis G3]|uniref:Microtubule associated protein n=1 Tax=Trichomonas vaginalis (strain ATCC PRA-98 / G3) TaxID=412133 RepID=A2EW85_TRIV3|nr:microtubule binding [Trichomonas vaginalis G3]EAY03062.1 hypothetical protein TVAG_171600 [Trichomonas vaginalis G3]KAI5484834.1 microtubule binding [Trichomonas vaginalis G3]|eukprot:XP_001315285.1 hypothetical protein [Trichomonas vaginalis G3]
MDCDSPIQIRVSQDLDMLWDQLGVEAKDRVSAMASIQQKCLEIYNAYVLQVQKQTAETKMLIAQIQQKHKQAMAAYGIPEKEIYECFKSSNSVQLLEQLAAAKLEYEQFKVKITEQVQKIENMVLVCKDLFDALEVPPEKRGEFQDVGETDFTRERIERFKIKVESLQNEVKVRTAQIDQIKSRINKIITTEMTDYKDDDLKLLDSKSVHDSYIKALSELEKRVNAEKSRRVSDLSSKAMVMIHLWDILGVKKEQREGFLAGYTNINNNTLDAMQQEIEKLTEERDKLLPKLIEGRREEVNDLWTMLHISVENRPHIVSDGKDLALEYKLLEDEILRLKEFQMNCHDILEVIFQREGIISDYNYAQNVENDPSRLLSRGKGMAKQLINEEKARRRYAIILPKVNKKLRSLLIDYYKKNKKHFEWDGIPYIEKLDQQEDSSKSKSQRKDRENIPCNSEDVEEKAASLPKSPRHQIVHKESPVIKSASSQRFRV